MIEIYRESLAQQMTMTSCVVCELPSAVNYEGLNYCGECHAQVMALDEDWLREQTRRAAVKVPKLAQAAWRLEGYAYATLTIAVMYYLLWETRQFWIDLIGLWFGWLL